MHTQGSEELDAKNKTCIPSLTRSPKGAGCIMGGQQRGAMEKEDKEQQMLRFEVENCKSNIEFYKMQIENMEERLHELEKLKKAYEYY